MAQRFQSIMKAGLPRIELDEDEIAKIDEEIDELADDGDVIAEAEKEEGQVVTCRSTCWS